MLQITIPSTEGFNEITNEFVETSKEQTLQLEHSLVSLSKWEAKWKKPFLTKNEKPFAEFADYVRCMTLTQNVDSSVYSNLTRSNLEEIQNYINDSMTATTFSADENRKFSTQIITAEVIYYWMISFNIPVEFQKWHLNRLLTLIRVCSVKSQNPKKMSKAAWMQQQRELNEARRKALNTSG